MSATIHIQSDVACSVYHFESFLTSIRESEDVVIELVKGRHQLMFVSVRFGENVKERIDYEVKDDYFEDYIEIKLKNKEDSFISLFNVTDEVLANSIEDQYGNLYSKDWTRLLRGAYVPYNEIDKRCRIICDNAFSWVLPNWTAQEISNRSKNVHYIILPKNLELIGRLAFVRCLTISEISIPEKVSYIGDEAFKECISLVSINIPHACKVGKNVFLSCPSLIRIVSENATVDQRCLIDNRELLAFASANIEEYALPNEIEDVGTVLRGCAKLSKIILPKSLNKLSKGSLGGCKKLKEVVIPNSKTIIEAGAFAMCASLEAFISPYATEDKRCIINHNVLVAFAPKGLEKYSILKGVVSISESVFLNCKELRSIYIPDTVVSIGDYAFANSSLREIYLPDNIQQLGEGAFMGCQSLYSVRLSPNIHQIKKCVFSRCRVLSRISFCSNPVFISCAICRCPNLQIIEFHSELSGMHVEENAFVSCDKLKYVYVPVGTTHEYLNKLPERLKPLLKEDSRIKIVK